MDNNCIFELKTIKDNCKFKGEPLIEYYSGCLLKIAKSYSKIEESNMLYYVKQMVAPSFPLIIKHFLKCAEKYLSAENPEDKVTLLNDIQLSIETYLEVWETIVQSTNTADHILIQSASVASVRQVPVKICAYFASFLNELAMLFQSDQKSEYAFLVYPSFGKRPEANLLFSTMQEKGKVGIIRIPEKDIWNVTYLRMLICHEIFHIIPHTLRNRFDRAKMLDKIISTDLMNRILYNLDTTQQLKNKLGEIYFDNVSEAVKEEYLDNKDEEDRSFYSTEAIQFYSNYYIKFFLEKLKISTTELWYKIYGIEQPLSTFELYKERMDKLDSCRMQINENILNLLSHSDLPEICSFYTDIFREVFADLTFILSIQISAEEYFASFSYTPLQDEDFELVPDLYLRAGLVLQIMTESDSLNIELIRRWREWKNQLEDKINGHGVSFQEKVIRFLSLILEKEDDIKTNIKIFKSVWHNYLEHFREYRKKYLSFENTNSIKLEKFRKKYLISLDVNNSKLLYAISKREWEI